VICESVSQSGLTRILPADATANAVGEGKKIHGEEFQSGQTRQLPRSQISTTPMLQLLRDVKDTISRSPRLFYSPIDRASGRQSQLVSVADGVHSRWGPVQTGAR
jgi:hypothetical protein